ncbi:hypothetical protein LTR86_005410 [Recurvomyces mirabilis]|nr:hypothetical protein LTR86_005410 [Recurvomyces mirabilis]
MQSDPNSSRSFYAEPVMSKTGHKKAVHMKYGGINLHGTLHLITTKDYFDTFYARFYDILPSISPSYKETTNHHVLIHSLQGLTWISGEVLSALPPVSLGERQGADNNSTGPYAADFLALTDKPSTMAGHSYLGECGKNGNFAPSRLADCGDVIIALPINQAIGAIDVHRKNAHTRRGPLYPPLPAGPDFFIKLNNIQHSLTQENALTQKGGFSKQYLKTHHRGLLDSEQKTLRSDHVFWPCRNNNALLDTPVWKSICLPSQNRDFEEGMRMVEPYWQAVFPDKRERERWFPGSDYLVEAAYEFSKEEARKFLTLEMGSVGVNEVLA